MIWGYHYFWKHPHIKSLIIYLFAFSMQIIILTSCNYGVYQQNDSKPNNTLVLMDHQTVFNSKIKKDTDAKRQPNMCFISGIQTGVLEKK